MSFGEYNNRGSSKGGGDTEYQRLCKCVSNNVQRINSNVSTIQRLVDRVGTAGDVPKQLQKTEKETQQLAKETGSYLKQLVLLEGDTPTEKRQRKMQVDRLTNNFSSALNNFQKTQRVAAEKEKEYVSRARASSMGVSPSPMGGYKDNSTLIDFDRTSGGGGGGLQIQSEEEVSLEAIEERERAIRQLEADIIGVNEIFRDLGNMVHEQGEVIDSIEANVDNAAVHVETANQQLSKASKYQKAARKKMCCILVIVVIAAAIIGVIIYVIAK
ncbi:syntaxin-7-like [Actinia tenebrosa]|uniref:Syntaxin-7 n=1 Tax=Actinia tenebrosa TaxID=6105 RepID=A0A6P8HSN2_ACTTE|nr:syntaxin-7-like [Actinia tenebrosa]